MQSYKTTIAGIAAIMTAIAGAASAWSADQPIDWTTVLAAVMAGIGLIAAKDHKAGDKAPKP
jgi:1,4-dihydroxy-2-naphthoate octaprenyltransferase